MMKQGTLNNASKCPGPFKACMALRDPCVWPERNSCRINRLMSIPTLPGSTRLLPQQGYCSRQSTWVQSVKDVVGAATEDGSHEVSKVSLGELWHGFNQKGEQELVRMVHMVAGEGAKHAVAMEACAVCFSEVRQQGNTAGACQALVLLCEQGLVKDVPGLMSQLLDSFQAAAPLDVQACMLMLKTTCGMMESVEPSSNDMKFLVKFIDLLSRASAIAKQQQRLNKWPAASEDITKIADQVSWLTDRLSEVQDQLAELRDTPNALDTARTTNALAKVNSTKGSVSTAASATTPKKKVFKLRAKRTGHKQEVHTAVLSPDGATLATGSEDKTILVYSMPDGNYQMELHGHDAGVASLAISPDGRYLASGDVNGGICVWDLHDKQVGTGILSAVCCRKVASGAQDGCVESLAFSPDGTWLASLRQTTKLISIWNIQDAPEVDGNKQLTVHKELADEKWLGWQVAFHPKHSNLVLSFDESNVKTRDIEEGHTWEVHTGHSDGFDCFDLSSDGGVLVTGSRDASVRVFDAIGGGGTDWALRTSIVLQGENEEGHTAEEVWCVAVAADGSLAITGGDKGSIRVWDLKSGECSKLLPGHTGSVWSVALSPDSTIAVSAGDDATVRIWQLFE